MPSTRHLIASASVLLSAIAVTLAQTAAMPATMPDMTPATTGPSTSPSASSSTMPTTAPATNQAAISWDHAAQHVGETVTVTGLVISTYTMDDGHVILNVGKNYPEPDRFSIFMTVPANAPDPDATYAGKTVTVTGKIDTEHDAPGIQTNAADVTVQK